MAKEETVTQPRGALSTTAYVVNILMGVAFIAAVVMIAGLNMGWISSAAIAEPAPTIRTLPTTPPDPAAPQPAQAVATALPALPTPLPVGVQVEQPVPAPADAAPAPVSSDAPATIKTRAPVCFGGWWYIDGQNMRKSCSGTGGD
jgi:hypothetical protein